MSNGSYRRCLNNNNSNNNGNKSNLLHRLPLRQLHHWPRMKKKAPNWLSQKIILQKLPERKPRAWCHQSPSKKLSHKLYHRKTWMLRPTTKHLSRQSWMQRKTIISIWTLLNYWRKKTVSSILSYKELQPAPSARLPVLASTPETFHKKIPTSNKSKLKAWPQIKPSS